jgi:hypothetical protein
VGKRLQKKSKKRLPSILKNFWFGHLNLSIKLNM